MSKGEKKQDPSWPSSELLEQVREELRKRLIQEELELVLRLEIVDRLMMDLKVDPQTFRALWVQPLLNAGATLDAALVCIARSHFQPN